MNRDKIYESTIRDRLASRLEVLEPGLELVDIEAYLPNPQGTRGFVDILAKDSSGKLVLIELKRSDSAAREAVHEVLKYIESIKNIRAIKQDELRVFVVSTEWTELLVPFSSFLARFPFSTTGFTLTIDDEGSPISAKPIVPLELSEERLFTPWHELNLYRSNSSLQKGIGSYEETCKKKGILNYVLIELIPHGEHRNREIEATKAALNQFKSSKDQVSTSEVEGMLQEHTHMIYFATLSIPLDQSIEAIKDSIEGTDELQEFIETVEELNGEELSCHVQEKLMSIDPSPYRDHFEIGYPAKFGTKLLDDEQWSIASIRRYGSIKNNELLADETIISELRGEQGVTRQRYVKELSCGDASQIAVARRELRHCLRDNPTWNSHLQIILDELSGLDALVRSSISVFNPCSALLTIYLAVSREDGVSYLPTFRVTTKTEDSTQIVCGFLSGNGINPSMKGIVRDHFNDDPGSILMPLIWGGYHSDDRFILRDAGLTYRTFKIIESRMSRKSFELTHLGWEPAQWKPPIQVFDEYLRKNKNFINDIVDFYSENWNGFMTMYKNDQKSMFRT